MSSDGAVGVGLSIRWPSGARVLRLKRKFKINKINLNT